MGHDRGDDVAELESMEVHASIAKPCAQLFDVEDVLAGPPQVAWKLCQAAELNQDQMRAVAFVVKPMQEVWGKGSDAAELTTVDRGSSQADAVYVIVLFHNQSLPFGVLAGVEGLGEGCRPNLPKSSNELLLSLLQ